MDFTILLRLEIFPLFYFSKTRCQMRSHCKNILSSLYFIHIEIILIIAFVRYSRLKIFGGDDRSTESNFPNMNQFIMRKRSNDRTRQERTDLIHHRQIF